MPISHMFSVVELELLGVDQGPEDVFIRLAALAGARREVGQGAGGLAAGRGPAEGRPEELLDLDRVGPRVAGQRRGPASRGGELALDLARVQQHPALAEAG